MMMDEADRTSCTSTTDHLRIRPDYHREPVGKELLHGGQHSNPRYSHFRQAHFTAGDEEQFIAYWDTERSASTGLGSGSRTPEDVYSTFAYLFHEMKKGIYVRIRGGQMTTFLPFSKMDYENTFHPLWRWNTRRFPTSDAMFRWITERSGYRFHPNHVHKNVAEWYANNGLIRYEHPISENDSGVNMIHDMLIDLVREREIADVDFFINKRDFPVVSGHPDRHPYEAMYGETHSAEVWLTPRHRPRVEVMSMTTSDDHADIPVPTWEDWCRVSFQHDGRIFGKADREYPPLPSVPWDAKRPTAVFRGASTGLGLDRANPRVRFALLSLSPVNRREHLIDVGITKWNLRPRRECASDPFDTFSEEILDTVPIVPYMSLTDQCSYKYILHLPGHSCAYRLSYELGTGSVVIMYPSRYKLWYSDSLRPMVHYVPLGEDEDVLEKIRWCRENDDLMRTIAENALTFYRTVLARSGILDHWADLLNGIHTRHGAVDYPGENAMSVHQRVKQAVGNRPSSLISLPAPTSLAGWTAAVGFVSSMDERETLWRTLQDDAPDEAWTLLMDTDVGIPIRQNRYTDVRFLEMGVSRVCMKMKTLGTPQTPKDREDFLRDLSHERFMTLTALRPWIDLDFFPRTFAVRECSGSPLRSVMISEMVSGRTLDQWIQSSWTSPRALVIALLDVLSQTSLMIDWMQDMTGFMHMDCYPWNIMIQPVTLGMKNKTFPVWWERSSVQYQMRRMTQDHPAWSVYLIDFGRSHILYDGFPHQNVSPFVRHRMHDIVTIVWNAVYLLFRTHRLTIGDTRLIRSLMSFFDPILPETMRRGRWKIHELVHFLHVHKRFSRSLFDTMHNPLPPTMTPLHFFRHIQDLLTAEKYKRICYHPIPITRTTNDPVPLPLYRRPAPTPAPAPAPASYRITPVKRDYKALSSWLDDLGQRFWEGSLEGSVLAEKPSSVIFSELNR